MTRSAIGRAVPPGAAFVTGAVLGIATFHVTSEPASPDTSGLILGGVRADMPDVLGADVSIDLYNPERKELTVVPAAMTGWVLDDAATPVVLTAGEWTEVTVRAEPDCASAVEAVVDLAIDGETQSVNLGAHESLRYVYDAFCRGDSRYYVDGTIEHAEVHDGTLVTQVGLTVQHAPNLPGDRTVASMEADTPGFAADTDQTGLDLDPERTVTVDISWSVDDCTETSRMEWVGLLLLNADGRHLGTAWFSNHAVAKLARFAATVCPPSP